METSIPLLDLNAQYSSIKGEIKIAIDQVLDAQSFIMGDFVKQFEQEVASYCKSKNAFGCASGSDALLLALMAIDIKPGDYVITSPFTFFATAGAISRLGAIPIFIDIELDSFNIDPIKIRDFLEGNDKLSKRLKVNTKKIKAIIPVHLYGQSADMKPILELAHEFDLKIIEDAAQSIGTKYKNSMVGNLGDFGCFSFFPSKNLGAYGDAGLITVKDPELAEKVDILRVHGARPKYHHKYVGINSRLDAIQAAILSVKLKYLDEWSDSRKMIADFYNESFSELGISKQDSYARGCGVKIPIESTGKVSQGGRHIYHQYTILVKNRDELEAYLTTKGIGTSIYYPVPLHLQECFRKLGYTINDCPISIVASKEALSLPIYPELNNDQVQYITESIEKFFINK